VRKKIVAHPWLFETSAVRLTNCNSVFCTKQAPIPVGSNLVPSPWRGGLGWGEDGRCPAVCLFTHPPTPSRKGRGSFMQYLNRTVMSSARVCNKRRRAPLATVLSFVLLLSIYHAHVREVKSLYCQSLLGILPVTGE